MAYQAQLGGLFNSGVYPDSRPRIDVGGAIDALSNGASSLIHAAYLRAQVKQQMGIAEREQQMREAEAGYVAPHAEPTQASGTTSGPMAAPPTIAGAMMAPTPNPVAPPSSTLPVDLQMQGLQDQQGLPNAGMTPSGHDAAVSAATPALPSVTSFTPAGTQAVPGHYDYTHSYEHGRAVDEADRMAQMWGIRGDIAGANNATREHIADERAKTQTSIADSNARWRAALQSAHDANQSDIHRAITGAAQLQLRKQWAKGMVEEYGGNTQDILDWMDKNPKDAVGSKSDIYAAIADRNNGLAAQQLKLEQGGLGDDPDEAGAAVDAAHGTSQITLDGKPVTEDQLSDADLWEIKKQQGMSSADATAYVRNRKARPRGAKKPVGGTK